MIALLLPSYRRFKDIFLTIWKTPLSADCKFIVAANYSNLQLFFLKAFFSQKALFLNERRYGRVGCYKAYNLAFNLARRKGFDYVALWADDIMPQKPDWLDDVKEMFIKPERSFGIFSTDECHKGRFGWNFFGGIPCAHFFIAKSAVLGDYFLNPELNAYVGDNDVCVRMMKQQIDITLLPVRLNHNHTQNWTRSNNAKYYAIDIETFNRLHHELKGLLDDVVLKGDYSINGTFVVDSGKVLHTGGKLDFKTYKEFVNANA